MAEESEEAREAREAREGRRRLPRIRMPRKIWKTSRPQPQTHLEELSGCEEALPELLEEQSRRLIGREEQLFGQEAPSEEEQDALQKELEDLLLQVWTAVHNSFSESPADLEELRSAVTSIQQQEVQDRRWQGAEEGRVPVWRPQKCLSTHTQLLRNMVVSRLDHATAESGAESGGAESGGAESGGAESGGADGLSSSLKREVCQTGKRLKEDLLSVARRVKACYPPELDIVNVYAGLYQQSFSARLMELARPGLSPDDCCYLLFWVNTCYPQDVLDHEELRGKIKTACLGSLLPQEDLDRLEDQYLTHKQDKVKSWLSTALRKEEELWLSGRKPELIDQYCFSPLAVDVIQVIDSSLTEAAAVFKDQKKSQRITAQLDGFLSSYKGCLEEFMKGNHDNSESVMKANLVCIEQFREFLAAGRLSEQQTGCCMNTLTALRDYGYQYFTRPIHIQLKVWSRQVWTAGWLDGSVPVVDQLLDSLSLQLEPFTDLKPACREVLLSVLHQDVLQSYVKRTMKMKNKMKNREQQVGGASRLIDDNRKIDNFFTDGGSWLSPLLCGVAEILRLQDPGSVQLEAVSLARTYTDLSDLHVAALLSLKSDLSAADVRSIRRSVQENRLAGSTNHSPPFFSKVEVKWTNKISRMALK